MPDKREKAISRIEYRHGMMNDVSEAPGLSVMKWSGVNIPQDVLKSIQDNKAWELAGSYGNPNDGHPIEYHHLIIEHEDGETEIEFFNLGMGMFATDEEDIKRIFRVVVILMRLHDKSFEDNKETNREPAKSSRTGRNVPCPCGSGIKYKKCCGAPERLN